VKAAAYQKRAR